MAKQRLIPIDIMVGLAMVLVVVGHQSFDFAPQWYNEGLHRWIYRFHMEVFMFLSAFLIRYSYKPGNYFRYIGRKFKKFFVPFLLVGISVSAAKCWSLGLEGGDAWSYMWQSFKCLITWPMVSSTSFLWYVYVLFGFYLISPLVIRFPSWLKMVLCLLSMGLPLLGASGFCCASLFCMHTFFYFLGILCAEGWEELKGLKTWILGLLSLPFVVWSVMLLSGRETFLEVGEYDIVKSCLALPLFYFLARIIGRVGWLTNVMSRISKDCFWIYLLQMFFIWGFGLTVQSLGWSRTMPYALFIVISATLGLIGPMGCAWLGEKVGAIHMNKKSNKKRKRK